MTPLKPRFNPATWMLEVTGGSMSTMVASVEMDWPEHYRGGSLASQNDRRADELVAETAKSCEAVQITSVYAQPFGVQVGCRGLWVCWGGLG
jgi:hypothetical protein